MIIHEKKLFTTFFYIDSHVNLRYKIYMRKFFSILFLSLGAIISRFFFYITLTTVVDDMQYGYIEFDVVGILSIIFLFGLFLMMIGLYLLNKRNIDPTPKEEPYIYKVKDEIYIKLGGDYIVSPKKSIRGLAIFSIIFHSTISIILPIIICINTSDPIDTKIISLLILYFCFFAFISYKLWGPTIKVQKDMITYKNSSFPYSHITYRKVENADSNFFVLFNSNANVKRYKITYCHELVELFSITTDLNNAQRFDANVIHTMIENGYIQKKE